MIIDHGVMIFFKGSWWNFRFEFYIVEWKSCHIYRKKSPIYCPQIISKLWAAIVIASSFSSYQTIANICDDLIQVGCSLHYILSNGLNFFWGWLTYIHPRLVCANLLLVWKVTASKAVLLFKQILPS